jgi:hypothetical protein
MSGQIGPITPQEQISADDVLGRRSAFEHSRIIVDCYASEVTAPRTSK